MDPVDPVGLARTLIDIDSTTGREGAGGARAGRLPARARLLGARAAARSRPHQRDRRGRRAGAGVLHAFRLRAAVLPQPDRGRRAVRPRRLRRQGHSGGAGRRGRAAAAGGETRVGLVFVAGEERGSDGAKAANTIASQSRYLVNGEPTERIARLATRGVFRVRLKARGKAAHSGYPELGESAIEKLLDVLHDLRGGDVAGRPTCWAARTTRLASSAAAWRPTSSRRMPRPRCSSAPSAPTTPCATLAAVVAGRVDVEEILEVPAVRLHTLPGFDTEVFAYFSDMPFLSNWGTPLLSAPARFTWRTPTASSRDRRPRARRRPLRRPGGPPVEHARGLAPLARSSRHRIQFAPLDGADSAHFRLFPPQSARDRCHRGQAP